MSVRAFLAIEASPPNIVSKVQEVQRELLSSGLRLRLADPNQLHLTLKFFGEISEQDIQTIVTSLSPLDYAPFKATMTSLGVFPNPQRARVIWIGFDPLSTTLLKELERKVHKALANKVRFDPKPFEPHLTIARVKEFGRTTALLALIQKLRGTEFGDFLVDEVKLKKSVLTPQGPLYSDLYIFKLRETH